MNEHASKIKEMAVIGLMTAVVCVLAPISFYIPISPVPISLGSMMIYFVVTVLGARRGTVSVLLYILLGLAGLPVLSGFTGGAGKLFGPTGGYIIGYIFLALIFGFFTDHWKDRLAMQILGAILGTLALYLFGTLWLGRQLGIDFMAALWAGVIPYIPGDIVKLILAMTLGIKLRKRLHAAELL
ncbi:MAG: biotin transporter BioY [Clostridium sp.]|nr:biotin transporter BioY [Acetatifactor muris]MCM1525862.1 biotin transporter BioY [Bacteroides sp.]MCM1562598.1 biotin transporter BioY [Clostridium sp.]